MIRLILSITLPLTCFYAWSGNPCKSIDQISWLVSDWEQTQVNKSSSKVAHENWQRVSKNTLEGEGLTLDENEKVIFQESLRIVQMQEQLFYIAKVDSNDLPVAFKATECTENSIQFENLEHDFPQRLKYSKHENGLKVDVSDLQGKGFTVTYIRVQG